MFDSSAGKSRAGGRGDADCLARERPHPARALVRWVESRTRGIAQGVARQLRPVRRRLDREPARPLLARIPDATREERTLRALSAVAVDPTVSTRFAIEANDYTAQTVRVSTTQDGGLTWHVSTLSRSVLNQNFDTAENPSLAFDSSGRLSIVYTLADISDASNAVVITESSDGISFGPPAVITY